ncbi:hypothetical protein BU015_03100 [Staphylococcus simulans]|nr:hypothetical protein BU015_03100 [Staphylococcus simulans]
MMIQNNILNQQQVRRNGTRYFVEIPLAVPNDLKLEEGSTLNFVKMHDKYSIVKDESELKRDSMIISLVDRTLERHGDIIHGLIER